MALLEGLTWRLSPPKKFERLRRIFSDRPFRMLDVGCGRRSCAVAKRWFPAVVYHGVDREYYQGETGDYKKMDRFFEIDLEAGDLSALADEDYDVIIFTHVIEHLTNGLEVLAALAAKLKPGGYIYVEFPSVRSLALPNAEGTLNFCDDETHVRLYDIKEIANALLARRFAIVRAGRASQLRRLLLVTPFGLLHSAFHFVRTGRLSARGLWDAAGFADYVFARKRP